MTIPNRRILLIVVLWFAVAFGIAASGQLARLRPPMPQIDVVAITIALMVTVLRVNWARAWAWGLPIRTIVALHLTRAVAGGAFLYYYTQGALPAAFALPAGWGDIVVAGLAGVGWTGRTNPEVHFILSAAKDRPRGESFHTFARAN